MSLISIRATRSSRVMALANKLISGLAAVFPIRLFPAGLACALPIVLLIGLHFTPTVPAASMPVRGTLPWHNFLSGPTAWDEKDYRGYLDRMQALGLNYVAFHCYTGGAERYAPYVEPLIRIEYRNILPEASLDTSLTARWGYRPLAIPDFAFGTDRLFPRPHGARAFGARAAVTARNNDERYALSQRQMQRVIQMAHDRGIQVAIGFEFGIQPLEFWSAVPPGAYISGAGIPDPTHPAAIEILRHTLDNLLGTYPDLDWIWLWLHEHTMYVGKPNYSQGLKAMLEQVKLARKQSLDGVLAIHWRTEETRANLEAFARAAQDPDAVPTAGEFYRQDSARQFGAAGERIAPILDRLDQTRGWRLALPEFLDAYSIRSSQADPGSRATGQAPFDSRTSRPNTSSRTAGE